MTSIAFKFFSLVLGFVLITTQAAVSKEKLPSCFQLPENSGIVKAISKQNIISLEDGRELVMANIYHEKKQSHRFLTKWLWNKKISFYASGRLKDRYNRLMVQIIYKEDTTSKWLQKTLIKKGYAVAIALPTNWHCSYELLASEAASRKLDLDKQALRVNFPIINAENTKFLKQKPQGSFQIVKGTVLSISRTTQNTYINFSKNWRTDFTAVISNHLLKRKKRRWPKLKLLKGKTITLRGWLDHYNGPLIRLETPEMLEMNN